MKKIRDPLRSPQLRRLIAAVAVASAGAAGAGAVALAERPVHSNASLSRAVGESLAGDAAVAAAEHRVSASPKDAWRAMRPPWAHDVAMPASATDPSLPDAAAVIGAPDASGEAPPSF